MSAIVNILKSFWRLFIWWVVIQPWELGLRVRVGKKRTLLKPGPHFRVPYLDVVYKQSVRLRWTAMMPQTVTTRDGHTITAAGQLGYRIADLDRLYDTLHQAENAVRAIGQGAIAEYLHTHELRECTPRQVCFGALAALDIERYGLVAERFQLTTFCQVKTLRLIMDQHENIWEDLLNTSRDDSPQAA